MKNHEVVWGTIQRMSLHGIAAGSVLGLLYTWLAPGIGILLGAVVGWTTGLLEGVLMAAVIWFVQQTPEEGSRYRYALAAINGVIAGVVTVWVFHGMLSSGGLVQVPIRDVLVLLLFFVIPALFTGVAAWWATIKVWERMRTRSTDAA
jgi:hypothetical protein